MSIRVLIVDDSPTMRGLIAATLRTDPDIEIVGEAGDPLEARGAIKALDPDVVTLDIEMPNMSGLEFLERLMRLRPTPVVMVSTLTQHGADETIAALALGAVDCVGKPTGPGDREFRRLPEVVRAAAGARLQTLPSARSEAPAPEYRPSGRVVALGASTGGVEALLQVISGFPANCPPTVITQHMPASFTPSFAARLDRTCAPQVSEARDGDKLETGRVYLAPGGVAHLKVERVGLDLRCRLVEGDLVSGHRPSVDVLFRSVAQACGGQAVAALLTGMGRDGADGLLALRHAGAVTIAQDEATCVVFGMPRVAFEIGAAERQLPLGRIAPALLAATQKSPVGVA